MLRNKRPGLLVSNKRIMMTPHSMNTFHDYLISTVWSQRTGIPTPARTVPCSAVSSMVVPAEQPRLVKAPLTLRAVTQTIDPSSPRTRAIPRRDKVRTFLRCFRNCKLWKYGLCPSNSESSLDFAERQRSKSPMQRIIRFCQLWLLRIQRRWKKQVQTGRSI